MKPRSFAQNYANTAMCMHTQAGRAAGDSAAMQSATQTRAGVSAPPPNCQGTNAPKAQKPEADCFKQPVFGGREVGR